MSSYYGRYRLGEVVCLYLACHDGASPADPDATPVVDIWDESSPTPVATLQAVKQRPGVQAGLFFCEIELDQRFSIGRYTAVSRWVDGSVFGREVTHFEVVAGGDQDGPVTAAAQYNLPHQEVLIYATPGKIHRGINPRV